MEIAGIAAVVTGGASGLGEATARALAERGARVAILDLPGSAGLEAAKAIGEPARFFAADVTDQDGVTRALDAAAQAFGGLHAAVSCAGVGMAGRTVDRDGRPFDLRLFERTVRVNLIGTFNVARLAAVRMMRNPPTTLGERGVLVHTASIAAFDGQVGQVAYAASKGGVVAMTLPVARDLAPAGIRCCTIAPGTFATPMLMGLPEAARQALAAQIPFPSRLGDPAEFAALACHVIENPMLNGETIRLDGALRMPPR
jgi:NAD(P)-dependent dehydrogenase (short-subunit alcohol dehydrogenase family)